MKRSVRSLGLAAVISLALTLFAQAGSILYDQGGAAPLPGAASGLANDGQAADSFVLSAGAWLISESLRLAFNLTGPEPVRSAVPDGGSTLVLLAILVAALRWLYRRESAGVRAGIEALSRIHRRSGRRLVAAPVPTASPTNNPSRKPSNPRVP